MTGGTGDLGESGDEFIGSSTLDFAGPIVGERTLKADSLRQPRGRRSAAEHQIRVLNSTFLSSPTGRRSGVLNINSC